MTPTEIRALRHSRRLPQEDFARQIGVSRTTLGALEQGRVQPSRMLLLALAAYADGLSPYRPDPAHMRALLFTERRRINRPQAEPGLPFRGAQGRSLEDGASTIRQPTSS
ncbi:helix-turn-helix transcriptional regulator [Brevundimonas sp.]|jgi:DNA-binding XRE family transcriptional regulator|uniref:helix-turn-helix transcriptional regulator n=1 Tax=Brevundimonas sp. TaxID=1871086 RepID=UPI0037C0C9BB